MKIRNVDKADLPGLINVLEHCELFPSEYLQDMIQPHFNNPNSEEIWITVEAQDAILSIAYCAPMTFTNGTYNLYAIGVHEDYQGKGIGEMMMIHLEERLKESGHRVLIVETSSSDKLALTRKFYDKCGYRQEAVIHDFWDEGDHKVVFWKKL